MNFCGIPYPIEPHPMGFLRSQCGLDQIKSDLLVLLLTNPGERIMMPEFGTPLRTLMFEPNDSNLHMQARSMIIRAIDQWEPRVVINSIEVTGSQEDELNQDDLKQDLEYLMTIKIEFVDPQQLTQIQTLVLALPLASMNILTNNTIQSSTLNKESENPVF